MAAYARQAVVRGAGFVVSGNAVTLAAVAVFPTMTGGAGGIVTHFGVGSGSSGATELDFFGAYTPNITVSAGVIPKLDTTSSISNTTPDGMSNAAATAFLTLFFTNVAWSLVGNAGGLLPSSVAGSLYLSLHTASPGEGGNQSSSELSYT